MSGAANFEDLIAWQLSATLRDRILDLTKNGPVTRHADLCNDIRRPAGWDVK
jgi:hypothetical protein